MTPEERRKEALEEMRELLAEGCDPADAAADVGRTYDLPSDVVLQLSSRMIENIDMLRASAAASRARWQQKSELDGYVRRLEAMLQLNPNVDMEAYLATIPRADLTTEQYQDVFHRCNMAWLGANV